MFVCLNVLCKCYETLWRVTKHTNHWIRPKIRDCVDGRKLILRIKILKIAFAIFYTNSVQFCITTVIWIKNRIISPYCYCYWCHHHYGYITWNNIWIKYETFKNGLIVIYLSPVIYVTHQNIFFIHHIEKLFIVNGNSILEKFTLGRKYFEIGIVNLWIASCRSSEERHGTNSM